MSTDTARATMRLLGGENPTRPFVGPNIRDTQHRLRQIGDKGIRGVDPPYLCRFADGHVEIMFFDYYYLNWSRVHLGFIQHRGCDHHDSWPFPVAFSSFELQEACLARNNDSWLIPNERLTTDSIPENTSRYGDTNFSLVVGRFRSVRDDGSIHFYLIPATYTPESKSWMNPWLKAESLVPEGWCYPNDMLVVVDPSA